jgi:hypothetical protein
MIIRRGSQILLERRPKGRKGGGRPAKHGWKLLYKKYPVVLRFLTFLWIELADIFEVKASKFITPSKKLFEVRAHGLILASSKFRNRGILPLDNVVTK